MKQIDPANVIEGNRSVEIPARAKPRTKKKPVRKAKSDAPMAADIYAGMTVSECCKGCNENGCVISGRPYCAHPRKGGLHMIDLANNKPAIERLKEAQKKLATSDATKRFS
jgi:hypothetical protein